MYEHYHDPLLAKKKFYTRLFFSTTLGLLAIAVALFVGMLGYHLTEQMSWVDAFVNAAMILSGMGPVTELHTTAGKLFAGFYALFSGLSFILVIGLIFTPLVHRFFHKLNLPSDSEASK